MFTIEVTVSTTVDLQVCPVAISVLEHPCLNRTLTGLLDAHSYIGELRELAESLSLFHSVEVVWW